MRGDDHLRVLQDRGAVAVHRCGRACPDVEGLQGESGRHCGVGHCVGARGAAAGWAAASAPVACSGRGGELAPLVWRALVAVPWACSSPPVAWRRVWPAAGWGAAAAGGCWLGDAAVALAAPERELARWRVWPLAWQPVLVSVWPGWRALPQAWPPPQVCGLVARSGRVWPGWRAWPPVWRRFLVCGWAEPKERQPLICWACWAPSSTRGSDCQPRAWPVPWRRPLLCHCR